MHINLYTHFLSVRIPVELCCALRSQERGAEVASCSQIDIF